MQRFPYWRLSSFYFTYYMFVGAFVPYWGLYLKSVNFSSVEIGVLLSLFQVSRIFSPSFWGWLADRTNRRVAWIKLTALLGLLGYIGVFFGTSFVWLFFVMAALSIFTSSTLPLAEAVTMAHIEPANQPYGRIRVWGSIGFIVAVLGLGLMLDYARIESLLWCLLLIQATLFLLSFKIPEPYVPSHHTDHLPVWKIVTRPEVLSLLIGSCLMVSAHSVYYSFFSIFLEDRGYSKTLIGVLWAVGVVCEILMFVVMPKLTARFSLKQILLMSLMLAVLRFAMIGSGVSSLAILLLAQTLHAATFGSFHVASVAIVHQYFKGKHQAKGQAIYSSVGYGLGGTIGGISGGYALQYLGGETTFMLTAIYPLIGFLVVAFWLKSSHAGR
ncbi:MAG: MFS transporter [Betaproteobacteria bacterium HGW-Betaproteobacteria-1]|jgi:PPP family 3-phenylpropionic acid transporter|nr:MAG: MFS transporter [Betaproteobacteria bacterium HGW-Betaproteobacteria-1]